MTTAFSRQHTDIRTAEVLHLLNPPAGYHLWHGGPGVLACLEGVSAEQALWAASPNTRSIWHFVLHIAYWKYRVRQQVTGCDLKPFPRQPDNFPSPPEHPEKEQWDADKELLCSEDTLLVEAVLHLKASELDRSFPSGNRLLDQIMGIALHDAYHVAQIQLLKRLFEDRPSSHL